MSCGMCSEKTKAGASAATGAPQATGAMRNPYRCSCGWYTGKDGQCKNPVHDKQGTRGDLAATTLLAPNPVDLDLSRLAARWALPRQCWGNAFRALSSMSQLRERGLYVEGHCILRSQSWFVFEHAWVEMDGKIVEPTLLKDATQNNLAYFPGPRFTLAQVLEEYKAQRASRRIVAQLPLVRQLGRGGMGHPLFQQSYLNACALDPKIDALVKRVVGKRGL